DEEVVVLDEPLAALLVGHAARAAPSPRSSARAVHRAHRASRLTSARCRRAGGHCGGRFAPKISPPRVDTGWDGPLCDSGARRFERKVLVRRTDPDRPDDGGEREGCHQHREVFTNARTWPGGARDELPAVAVP